ncbi:xanthine/uracil permease [Mycena latifolia]|nr:xanthine/uracil permease [Mycena latifolia]
MSSPDTETVATCQPGLIASPSLYTPDDKFSAVSRIKHKLLTRDGWIGANDYAWFCTPSLPCSVSKPRLPPFYALDDELPVVLAIATGLQHALAMFTNIVTPSAIFASGLNLDSTSSAYMISAALIACGILGLLQMSRIRICSGYYIGTGLLTMATTSVAVITTGNSMFTSMYNDGTCPSITSADGAIVREACPDAYGKLIGTSLICAFIEIGMSFVPMRILKRVFPPLVTGLVIFMIGASLIGSSGIPNWGGGSNACQTRPATGPFALCPTISAPRPLPWGSPEFIGLGFLSFVSIPLTERFGSPFLKNISVLLGLAVGCIVAGATGYIDASSIKMTPPITFLWVKWFQLAIYPPAILPMVAVYVSLGMTAIGNTTAAAELSRQEVEGPKFDSRIQGGLLANGLSGVLSALFTVPPVTISAQSNGVLAITRCASRDAGRWGCVFLILFGMLGKISGVFLAIPSPVLGGVTTFLFGNIAVAGFRVLATVKFTRRDRIVLGAALSLGLGDLVVPDIFTHLFEGVRHPNTGVQALFDSITIVLSTPFLIAAVTGIVLNLVLPDEV